MTPKQYNLISILLDVGHTECIEFSLHLLTYYFTIHQTRLYAFCELVSNYTKIQTVKLSKTTPTTF